MLLSALKRNFSFINFTHNLINRITNLLVRLSVAPSAGQTWHGPPTSWGFSSLYFLCSCQEKMQQPPECTAVRQQEGNRSVMVRTQKKMLSAAGCTCGCSQLHFPCCRLSHMHIHDPGLCQQTAAHSRMLVCNEERGSLSLYTIMCFHAVNHPEPK